MEALTPEALRLALSDGSFIYALQWWATLLLLGAIGWRVLRGACVHWLDRGRAIAAPIALLGAAYPLWVVAHWMPVFGTAGAWASTLLVAACALFWVRVYWVRRVAAASAPALRR
ncbi:MAG: hypothetical protein AB7S98_12970, partial [Burkholderiaceae bacterium]